MLLTSILKKITPISSSLASSPCLEVPMGGESYLPSKLQPVDIIVDLGHGDDHHHHHQLLVLQATLDELLFSDVAVVVDVEGGKDLHRPLHGGFLLETLGEVERSKQLHHLAQLQMSLPSMSLSLLSLSSMSL